MKTVVAGVNAVSGASADSYGYDEPRERYIERRGYEERGGIGIRVPGVSVGIVPTATEDKESKCKRPRSDPRPFLCLGGWLRQASIWGAREFKAARPEPSIRGALGPLNRGSNDQNAISYRNFVLHCSRVVRSSRICSAGRGSRAGRPPEKRPAYRPYRRSRLCDADLARFSAACLRGNGSKLEPRLVSADRG